MSRSAWWSLESTPHIFTLLREIFGVKTILWRIWDLEITCLGNWGDTILFYFMIH